MKKSNISSKTVFIFSFSLLQKLEEQFGFDTATACDGEVIIHLYARGGAEYTAKHLDGVFAFIILDTAERRVYVGRDTFGVRPAFKSYIEEKGFLSVCSEAKGMNQILRGKKSCARVFFQA